MNKEYIELSLIIPALNEQQMIQSTLLEVASFLKMQKKLNTTEVIVVAAAGGDETAKIAKANSKLFKHFRVVEPGPKVGKGRDVKAGVEAAHGKYIVFTDADLATPINHLTIMEEKLRGGTDVVIGIRDIDSVHETFKRRISSRLSNLVIRVVAVPGISDTQCGFKGFRDDVAQKLFSQQQIMGWGFDIELLALARRYHYSVVTMKIHDWRDPKGDSGLVGESQLGAMLKTLQELLKIRINLWRGVYK